MFENSKFEYVVRSCSGDNLEELQELLNQMAGQGWELYSLNESEGEEGFQYNCIFSRVVDGSYADEHDDEIAKVGHFKSRMEKLFNYKDEPYEQAKFLQEQLRQKNLRINEIKQLLDSNNIDIDRENLNQEISEQLAERGRIKNKFTEIISPAYMYERLQQHIITVELSEELSELIDNEKNGELITESVKLRQTLADKLGFVLPSIKFVSADNLSENQYSIKIRRFRAVNGVAYAGYRMFKQGQANIDRKPRGAINSVDPTTSQKVFWIEEAKTKSFWDKGLSPAQLIISHIEFVACKYIEEILSYGEVLNYISVLGDDNLFLAEELLQSSVTIADIHYILAKLLREKVCIKDVIYVFEKLNDLTKFDYENDEIVDNLRILLSRQICSDIADFNNIIYSIIPSAEENLKLKKALDKKQKSKFFVQNSDTKAFVKSVLEKIKNSEADISNTAIVVKNEFRLPVFYLIEQLIPELRVISEDEITEEFNIAVL